MDYSEEQVVEAIKILNAQFPDSQLNNSKVVGSTDQRLIIAHEIYQRQAMKRSKFKNVVYEDCVFENVAFTDSAFHNTSFKKNRFFGNSFICCDFYKVEFFGTDDMSVYEANNFSQSNFTSCHFSDEVFRSCGFLQTVFHKCEFTNVVFRSSTLEGSRFVNCELNNIDISNVSVEYIELLHTALNNVSFSFYQLPFVIGSAEYIINGSSSITVKTTEKSYTLQEYQTQLENLTLYFWDKAEYFPMCNLQIAKGDISAAKVSLLDGINASMNELDFRMIRHFCRLARRHNLLDEVTIFRILHAIDTFLAGDEIPPERLNDCLIHAGEIRGILLSGNENNLSLNLSIRTNVNKKNKNGLKYVNLLCNELNTALSSNDVGQTGFQVAVSSHSPFEIIINIICAVGSVATIADLIWKIIDKTDSKESKSTAVDLSNTIPVDNELRRDYVNCRIDLCKEQLLNLKDVYSKKKMNKYIDEITQKLKTDLDAFYEKDILIFRVKNPKD